MTTITSPTECPRQTDRRPPGASLAFAGLSPHSLCVGHLRRRWGLSEPAARAVAVLAFGEGRADQRHR